MKSIAEGKENVEEEVRTEAADDEEEDSLLLPIEEGRGLRDS